MKTILFFLMILISSGFFLPGTGQQTDRYIVGMDLNDYQVFLSANSPLDELYFFQNRVYLIVSQSELGRIRSGTIQSLVKLHPGRFASRHEGKKRDMNGLYHNYVQTEALLFELADRYPDLAEVFSAGQSIEGREIYVIKISDNVQQEENEPNFFVVGCHHAREWISVEIPLLFTRHLLEQYSSNSQVQKVVNGAQVYIMPIQNPDGLEYSIHHYRFWRKNRRYNGDFSWGVDTNRNYGYQWGYSDTGSSPDPDSEVYRGPSPFSEPETIAVRDFLLDHPPSGTLSYHNFSQLILFPWGYIDEKTPDDVEMRTIAQRMSELIYQVNGRTYQYGTGPEILYPTNGGTVDWVYATFGTPAYTVELPNDTYLSGAFFTTEEEIDRTFRENLPSMMYFAGYMVDQQQ